MNAQAPFLTAEWRDLLILNHEVAPGVATVALALALSPVAFLV